MNALRPELIASGYEFPESPRWWDDSVYFTDTYGKKVYRIAADGSEETEVAHLEGMPSGLGELPDGTRLVGEQSTRKLWRLTEDGVAPEPFSDLSGFTKNWTSDMITGPDGVTYTDCLGHDLLSGEAPAPGWLVMTTPEGVSSVAADGIMMPNGLAITEDGSTLVVAETIGERIIAFDRRSDGTLTNRRTWAELPGTAPDGICLDAEGGVWMGSVFTSEFIRVMEGGKITHRIPTEGRWALATLLGGKDRSQLFLLTTDTDFERIKVGDIHGRIEVVDVDVPGVGTP